MGEYDSAIQSGNGIAGSQTGKSVQYCRTFVGSGGRVYREEYEYFPLRSLVEYCARAIVKKIHYFKLPNGDQKNQEKRIEIRTKLPDELVSMIVHILIKRRKLYDETLKLFLHPFIKTLNLTNSPSANISLIGRSCPSLTSLSVRGCLPVSDSSLFQMSQYCVNLVSLQLTYNKKITDKGISQLVQKCTQLKKLDLNWCSRLTDKSLEEISENCPFLEELHISSCRSITENGIQAITQKCHKLKLLEMRNCVSVFHLKTPIRCNLIELEVSNCTNLDDITLQSLTSSQTLQMLICGFCSQLSDTSIEGVIKSSAIIVLDLNNCNFQNLHFQAHNLTTLTLDGCQNLVLETFQWLGCHCTSLTNISMRGCTGVTDSHVDALTRTSASLTCINLSRCTQITDQSVLFVTERCCLLESCDISWCEGLTDLSVKYFSRNLGRMPRLQCLKAFGCTISLNGAIDSLIRGSKELGSCLNVQYIQNERDWSTLECI